MSQKFRQEKAQQKTINEEWEKEVNSSKPYVFPLAVLTGLITFIAYFLTLYPTVGGGDSGELIVAASHAGVAHPPGYPLYTFFGKLYSLIPFNSVAWRVNLMSAVNGSIAAIMIFLGVHRWSANAWAGLLAAMLFGFSPLVWNYAIIAEVFSLNNMIIAIVFYQCVCFFQNPSRKLAYWIFLSLGLGMSNHHTFLFYAVPISFFVLWTGRTLLLKWREIAKLAGFAFLGLTPYIHLPFATHLHPFHSWGESTTLDGFLHHVLRRGYGTFALFANTADEVGLLPRLLNYFKTAMQQTLYFSPLFALLGLSAGFRKPQMKIMTLCAAVAYFFYVLVFHMMAATSKSDPILIIMLVRFWQQPHIIFCMFAGIGLPVFCNLFGRYKKHFSIAIVAVATVLMLGLNYKTIDQHNNWSFFQYAKSIADQLPQNAVLLTEGDIVNHSLLYIQECEGYRTDIKTISQGMLARDWARARFTQRFPDLLIPQLPGNVPFKSVDFISANFDKHRIFFSPYLKDDSSDYSRYVHWTYGLVNELKLKTDKYDFNEWNRKSYEGLALIKDFTKLYSYSDTSWEIEILRHYWSAYNRKGVQLITRAMKEGDNELLLREAIAFFEKGITETPDVPSYYYKNLGLAFYRLFEGRKKGDALPGVLKAWEAYLARIPETTSETENIRRIVTSLKARSGK